MLFSSVEFLFIFFPLVFIVYYALSFSRFLQNIWLFAVSIFFYAWGEPVYVIILLISILVNWGLSLIIGALPKEKRKIPLAIACILNIGVLFVFKYLGFITSQINGIAEANIVPTVSWALPIGISFYTFQALSYCVDVYNDKAKAQKNPLNVGLYISFFPQLIAGPIVKYNQIEEQIKHRKPSLDKISRGFSRFIVGLAKKTILANNLAVVADAIFNWSEFGTAIVDVPVLMAWMGIIAYTMQIYFDFSGYSDMAIGLGLMFGFEFDENFNYPYYAVSVSDFWKRWHISLTSWFREYVYFPLGGSRTENKDLMVRNLLIVWLLTGIWHGAGWNFIFWGLLHFVFQLAERFFHLDKPEKHIGLMRVYTLFEVMMGWVLFRTVDLYQASSYYKNLFGLNGNSFFNERTWFMFKENWVYLALGIACCIPLTGKGLNLLREKITHKNVVAETVICTAWIMAVLIVCSIFVVRASYSPFIYFNF